MESDHNIAIDTKISETTECRCKSQGALERPGGGRHQAHGHLSAGTSRDLD